MKKTIGVIAPSSTVPPIELDLSMERLKKLKFDISLHPQCKKKHLYFAGSDQERAQAVIDYAYAKHPQVLWCARGGYGAARILPYLDQATQLRGVPPKKLLVGYSDSTALHEFMREKWGWATLHAPMPGLREFFEVTKDQMETLRHWIEGSAEGTPPQWKLKFLGRAPHSPIEAELTGGNLSLLASMVGTPYSPHFQNRILFIEDIGEGIYRLDRYFEQLKQSGLLKTTRAIILGTFDLCKDRPPMGLKKRPASARERKTGALGAVRPEVSLLEAQRFIFGEVATQLGIPVAAGLPVGHGPGLNALPLGARYRLDSKGVLKFVSWDAWIARARR